MKNKLGDRIISFILTFNLVFNNLAPFVSLSSVRAQDVTPEPTAEVTVSPTVEVTPVETVSPTVEPTQDVTPTPIVDVSPTVEVTPVETVSPTVEPTIEPTEAPSVPSPPQDSNDTQAPQMSVEPSPSPSPTPEVLQSSALIGTVETQVVESYSCRADSLNGCLVTDKPDYAPTEVAVISGYGFSPNTQYTLRVYSTDEPATDNSYQITTDSNGSFTYSYQLDGNYRPNYTVELKDSAGNVVASVTFTDTPASGCQDDSAGANDEVNQKDLTKMCVNYSGLPTSESVLWNWDDTGFSGSNTGDACSLYDTDGDGNANFSLCVGISGNPAAWSYTKLYSCSDNSGQKCTSPSSEITSFTSSCSTTVNSTDPFSAGNNYPNDTQASCTVNLSDFGLVTPTLVDVCSYESGSPTSNPADCILFKANAGKLTVTKVLSPNTDPGLFNLQIDGTTQAADVGGGGTTLTQEVSSTITHTVGETAGTSTSLSNYTSTVLCKDEHGTGDTISTTGTNPWTLSVGDGDDILCTITNTRINNASVTIVKDSVPNDPQDFSFTTSGTGLSDFDLDDDSDPTLLNTKVFSNLAANTYSVAETGVSGWTQTSATCTDGSPVSAIALSAGENVTCTFTNTKKGHIIVDKVTNPSGDGQSFSFDASGGAYVDFSLTDAAAPNDQELVPGVYSVSETVPSGWDLTNTSCVSSIQDTETATSLELDAGETITCTFTNTKRGKIIIEKQTLPDGSPQSFNFTADYDGDGFSLTDGQQNDSGFLVPGSYTVGETVPSGWDLTGIVCTDPSQNSSSNLPTVPTATVNLAAGETVICVFTNTQRGHIIVDKVTDPSGSGQSFDFDATGSGYIDFSLTDAATANDQEVVPGSYSVLESAVSGWDQTSATCDQGETIDSIDVDPGETVTCTFINTQRGSISGYKYEDKSGDTTNSGDQTPVQGLLVELWHWVTDIFVDTGKTDTTDSNGFYEFLDLIPGVYQVREILSSLGAGWTNVTPTTKDVTLTPGESDTGNNFINTQYGTIIVEKQTIPNGDQTSFDFDLSYGDNDADLSDGQQDSTGNLLPGSYAVSENTPVGWDLTSTVCTSSIQDTEIASALELDSGETITCVFTNSRKPTLTLVKTVINNNGGSAVITDFQGKINNGDVPWSVAQTLNPGSYTTSEITLTNYTASVWGTDCNADGTITLAYGDNKTCSITNDDNAPALHLRKTVTNDNGGTALATAWTLTATGTNGSPTNLSGSTPVDSGSNFKADTYALGELGGPSGYTAGVWDCGQSTMTDPTHVVVPFGGDVACTINNNDNVPSLTLNKVVVNDNGGIAKESDWTLTATGPTSISGPGAAGSTDVVSDSTFDAGTYTLSESTGPAGYTASSWVCTGGSQNGNEITIGLGESAICTITNNDNEPSLTLVKQVTNDDGGTSLPSAWTLTATGPTEFNGAGPTVSNGASFDAGTYDLSESGLAGYSASDWVCIGGNQTDGNTVGVGLGENVTCTIVNDDIAPRLLLVKEVINDNGGIKSSDDWTLSAEADSPDDGRNFDNLGGSGVFETVFANVSYALTESTVSGYAQGSWNCEGAGLQGNVVNLGLGAQATCTITNDDIPPSLILNKVLIIDNGGTENESDWTLTATGPTSISGPGASGSEDVVSDSSFEAGTYTLGESGPSGYTASSWNCIGGTQNGNEITVGLGETATCTINNNDISPTLKLVKEVTNDDGGTATSGDWTLRARKLCVAGDSNPDCGFEDSGDSITFHPLLAGTAYTLFESGPSGYTAGNWSCNGGTLNGNKLTLGLDEEVTCTITNDDIAPTLKLVKSVTNDDGGDAVAGDWDLTASGTGGFTDQGDSVTFHTVLANEPYTLSESSVDGYAPETWDCDNAGLQGDVVMLGSGEEVTCTITNDDIAPTITLTKVVVGGTAAVEDFSLYLGGNSVTSGVANSVLANIPYDIDEDGPSGYSFTSLTGDPECPEVLGGDVQANEGENISCTITNTRDTGSLTVNKQVDTDGNGTFETGNDKANILGFRWDFANSGSENKLMGSSETVNTGTYPIYEKDITNYHFVGWFTGDSTCDEESELETSLPADVNVNKDETTMLTFCNARDTGTITVDKITSPSESPEQFTINLNQGETVPESVLIKSSILADQDTPATYTIPTGQYWFEELEKTGWDLTNAECTDGEVAFDPRADQFILEKDVELTCTFTNTQRGKVIVTKFNDLNDNGKFDENEPTLPGWNMVLTSNGNQETDVKGIATFENVLPGTYYLDETLKEGWRKKIIYCTNSRQEELTPTPTEPVLTLFGQVLAIEVASPGHQVDVSPGEEVECFVGNQSITPELQISKSNDATGDKSVGDIVTYTITVKALTSQVLGVVLKDLLPNGFEFQNVVSIIKNGSIDITSLVGDPHYASPGTYNLGDMNADDEIVIKYAAKVGSSVDPGLYKDVAYATGKDVLDNRVLALAQPEGYVATNFVGTSVSVNANLSQGGDIDIEGEVLGASTYLPATGGNQVWVIIASILTGLGLLVMFLGLFMNKSKKIVTIVILVLAFGIFGAQSTFASNLSIRLEQPKSPTSKNDFKITFTVLDLTESPSAITVKCYKKGPSDGGYSQFGSDISVTAGGNTGDCSNVSDFVNTNGTYQFLATANNGSETASSEFEGIISVGYNTQGDPAPVSNYKKEKVSSCQYRVTFRTADDGLTSRVEIYRSENTSFNLDGGTRVADIAIGPNQDGSFEESVPDCNKTYYYVVRAFNSSGSPSGPVGDSAVTTTTSSTTIGGGAIPVEGINLPGGTGGGEVLGEEEEVSPTAKPEVVEVKEKGIKGAVMGVADFVKKKTKLSLLFGLVVLGLSYGVYYFIKKKKAGQNSDQS